MKKVTPESTVGTKTFHLHGSHSHATVVAQRDPDGFRMGIAICNPLDQFSKRLGRRIAFGRLTHGVRVNSINGQGYYFIPGHVPQDEVVEEISVMAPGVPLERFIKVDQVLQVEMQKLFKSLPLHLELTVVEVQAKKAQEAQEAAVREDTMSGSGFTVIAHEPTLASITQQVRQYFLNLTSHLRGE